MTTLRSIADERALGEEFARPAATVFPLARLLRDGDDATRWSELAALGWLTIGLPEAEGGVGLGPIEETLAAEILGRQLVTPTYLATVVALHLAVASGAVELVGDLASGRRKAALALGTVPGDGVVVIDGAGCDLALMLDADALTLLEIAGLSDHDSCHWSLPLHAVARADPCLVSRDVETRALAETLAAAMLAGVAGQACDSAVAHAKVREQFGQPIGAFQAVKHHCANMAIVAYAARESAFAAALALAEGDGRAALLATGALNCAVRAARDNGGLCIQVFGGMGFSAECEAHHFIKRARLIEAGFGGLDRIRRRLIDAPGANQSSRELTGACDAG